MRHGVSRDGDGLRLAVWAPRAERLQLGLGGRVQPLTRAPDGWWTAELPQLPAGTPYALVFPDGRVRPDPAARAQLGDVHGPSALFDPGEFPWTDGAWSGIPLEALVFYELHVGTFTEEGTLDAAAARLSELVNLGVTCVELMPLQPFGGLRNWGYDGVLLHAVHGGYGGPAALQRFVDRAHALGLGVCLDVVYNHLGPEGNYLGEFGPYTTSRHRSPWGDGMNYDGPDSGPVRGYMVQAARSWVEDFHVDALRLDAVHAIVDDSEVHLVREIASAVHMASGGRAKVIAESDLNDRRVVDPPPTGWGCDAAWADDFHHAVHALLTGERSAFYADFGQPEDLVRALEQGFVYQGQQSRFRKRPHGTP
ncbi:MAG TPA: alpha-amylase family glycosyl hydrolase, partial [Myxococcaceae bacterium]|nr:alpha-amylase family glycosyl hydrolase [Myxococcaceae bacterium]